MREIGRTTTAATLVGVLCLAGIVPAVGSTPLEVSRVQCTPGYSPCIPLKASDVDCNGGSGNGPRYTRRGVAYTVRRGMDRYGLDADRDGKGCE